MRRSEKRKSEKRKSGKANKRKSGKRKRTRLPRALRLPPSEPLMGTSPLNSPPPPPLFFGGGVAFFGAGFAFDRVIVRVNVTLLLGDTGRYGIVLFGGIGIGCEERKCLIVFFLRCIRTPHSI